MNRWLKYLLLFFLPLFLLFSFVFTGHAQPPEDAGPPPGIPGRPQTLDDLFAEVGRRAPGFGGVFIENNVLNIFMLTPSRREEAEAGFAEVFGRGRIPAGGINILQGEYSFIELENWHDRLGAVFDIPGVILTDIDERRNRLRVGIESEDLVSDVEKKLEEQSIPREAVNIEVVEPVIPLVTLRDKIRPLEGGTQIRFSNFICTLGFNAIRSGVAGFVINSHCTDRQGEVDGTQYYQPTSGASNFIGTETVDPSYTNSKCPTGPGWGGKRCRWSDSAFAEKDLNVEGGLGVISRPNSVNTGSLTIAGRFNIISEGISLVGEIVNKVGRTTGWSQGTVTDTCVNTGQSGSNRVILCEDFVNADSDSGDSGSPVFFISDQATYNVEIRGILWGGSGDSFVYSPIGHIKRNDELGSMTVVPAVAISLTTDGATPFGIVPLGGSADTTPSGTNDVQTVQVTTGPADLSVRSSDFSDGTNTWALSSVNGADQIKWDFSNNGTSWTNFSAADTLFAFDSNVAQGESRDLYLMLTMPTSTSSDLEHQSTVTIVASEP